MGCIAGENTESGKIINCKVVNLNFQKVFYKWKFNVGAIAGSNNGEMSRCSFEGNYDVSVEFAKENSSTQSSYNIGGLVGESNSKSKITGCTADIQMNVNVAISCQDGISLRVGGMVGTNAGDITNLMLKVKLFQV